MDVTKVFQGFSTLLSVSPQIAIARIVLIALGIFLFFLGCKRVLEPLIMLPMSFGMASVNAAVLYLSASKIGTIFIEPMISHPEELLEILQIDFLQPIYTFTFSNGLIACLVFLGIGVMTDISYLLAYPFTSILIAFCAELGTLIVLPIAISFGLSPADAAATALIGGADGPMVLFASLTLAKDIFVPITIVAYLYLSLTYGGYPFLIRIMVPKSLRSIRPKINKQVASVTRTEKLAFSIIACILLCILFPMAAPLFLSFFLGIAIREASIKKYSDMLENTVLYFSTFLLGLMLGVLCEASIVLDATILKILILGMLALFISGIGGLIGGYLAYFISGKKFNPVIGIAGVSCVPTTAKVAQLEVSRADTRAVVLPFAIGANVSGVITTAIITGLYIAFFIKR